MKSKTEEIQRIELTLEDLERLLERAKAIEDGERLLRARRGLHVVTREPSGAA